VRVLVVGDAMLDVVVRPLGPLAPTSDTPARVRLGRGGAAANLAVALAAADASVRVEYAAAVGDDAAGELFRRELEASAVRARLEVHPGATGVVVALVGADAERAMMTDRGVNSDLSLAHLSALLEEDFAHLHVSGYSVLDPRTRPLVTTLLAMARDAGVSTSVDVCSVEPLRQLGAELFVAAASGASMVFANEEEALALSGAEDVEAALTTLASRWDEALVTRGSRGALVRRQERMWSAPAVHVDALDTTGAGDCATGTYLAGRLAGADVGECLRRAMDAAAVVVAGLGSRGQSRL